MSRGSCERPLKRRNTRTLPRCLPHFHDWRLRRHRLRRRSAEHSPRTETGDLPNLLLAFDSFATAPLDPWAAAMAHPNDDRPHAEIAAGVAAERKRGLEAWGIGEPDLAAFRAKTNVRVITPGSTASESLHVLSSLERRSSRWDHDPEAARSSLSAAVWLVLRLVGRDSDPARSKDHVLLSLLAERRLRAGQSAELAALLSDLNTLLASPTFASWRSGATLDVDSWLTPAPGAPAVIVNVTHPTTKSARWCSACCSRRCCRGCARSQARSAPARWSFSMRCTASFRRIPPTRRRSARSSR